MNTASQLPLITEPSFYHDAPSTGFIALLVRNPQGHLKQKSFRVSDLGYMIEIAPRDRDCYLSQAQFMRPNRRAVNLYCLPLLFCDLDPWNTHPMTAKDWIWTVLYTCKDDNIPPPSLIVYSGRGVHLKWILDKPLPRQALPRWNLAQQLLGERCAPIGADPQARDASRVLRLEQTVNSKTGERCEVVWINEGADGCPLRYDFDLLFDDIAPLTRGELDALCDERATENPRKKEKAKSPALSLIKGGRHGLKRINYQELAWHRMEDLRTLAALRAARNDGTQPLQGQRMLFLFWTLNFMALSQAIAPANFWQEAQSLAANLAPGWSFRTSELSTLYHKTCAYVAGERVEFEGRVLPPLYTPRNATLIDRFAITDDEQRQLKTIISKSEARLRHAKRERVRRSQAGAQDRATYEATAQHRREVARALRAEGMSFRRIAAELGISVGEAHRLLK